MYCHSKDLLKLLKILVLCTIIHTCAVSSNKVYYITQPSIIDVCPESESCITFSTLVANTSNFLDTNTTLIFLKGNHTLDTDLNMRDIDHYVKLSGTNSDSVSIICTSGASLNFNNITQLQISGLEFIKCKNRIESVGDSLLEDCHFCDGHSGSALLLNQTNANIFRCSFTSNLGGSIFVISSNLSIRCSHFDSNEAALRGGAIYIGTRNNVSITDCEFVKNKASDGGALYVASDCIIHNSTFVNNIATTAGGAIDLYRASIHGYHNIFHGNQARLGGAIFVSEAMITIDSSHYSNNTAGQGGIIYSFNGGIAMSHSSLFNNKAIYDAGAIHLIRSDTTAYNISLNNNKAGRDAGAIWIYGSSITLYYSSFNNNEAVKNGGFMLAWTLRNIPVTWTLSNIAVYSSSFDSNRAGQDGGVLHMDIGNTVVYNKSLFYNNQAGSNGGVTLAVSSDVKVHYSSFESNKAGHDGGTIHADKGNITVNYSSFTNNTANNNGGVVYETHTYTTLYGSFFVNNKAGSNGGVFYKTNNDTQNGTVLTSKYVLTTQCTFVNNSAGEGGVMYLHDAHLTVLENKYRNNQATSNGGVFHLNECETEVTESTFQNNTAVNSGGVVYILIHWFQNHLRFERSDFQCNRALSGGVIAVIANDLLTVSESTFTNNSAVRGGVVYSLTENNLIVNNSSFSHNSADSDGGVFYLGDHNKLEMKNSKFTYNSAENKGGVVCSLIQTKFVVAGDNCTFVGNQARSGGAVYASESSVTVHSKSLLMTNNSAVESGGVIYLYKVSLTFMNGTSMFIGNGANNGGFLYARQSSLFLEMKTQTKVYDNLATNNGGGLYLTLSELTVRGYSFHINRNIAERIGGGIFAEGSSFLTEGEVYFANNAAENGGGVGLENNAFLFGISHENDSFIKFGSNRARSHGGAIYIDDDSYADAMCRVTAQNERLSKINENECFSNSIYFFFSDNYAGRSGSNLFGGFLDRCEVKELNSSQRENGFDYFQKKSNIKESQEDIISSHPIQLCFCQEGRIKCDYQPELVRVDRGKTFSIDVIAYDQIHNAVNSTVSSSLNSSAGGLDVGQDIQHIQAACTKLYFTLFSPHDYEELTLSVDSPCNTLGMTDYTVMIEITCSCPIGFEIRNNDQTSCDCVCHQILESYDRTDCDEQSESILRQDNFWITYIYDSNSSGYIIYPNCPYDYCHTPEENIAINLNNPEGYEAQCVSYRSGLLCGSCKQNFSVSLGSSSCLHCPTYWPGIMVTIIIVFILSGICLVALLLVLNITVATGTLNAIIFYVNIVAANQSALLSSSKVRFAAIFISWLNFDIGFDTCFFDGMDMYIKTWFQIAFPVYVILLVVLIIQLSYYCGAFGRLIGRRDPVATLATLILLSYAKFIQTIITAFSSATLIYPDGSKKYVWLPDASVEYLTGKHAALFFIALFILLAGLLYTVLLITWQCLLRCPRKRIKLIMSQKLSFFLQTYHVLYTLKHRYWTGLLLLVRVSIYLISGLNPTGDPRISLLSTVLIMSCLFLYSVMFGVRIYKKWSIHAMETITYININAVSVLTWYALEFNNNYQAIITNISVGITFILLVIVILYHTLQNLCTNLYSIVQDTSAVKKLNEKRKQKNFRKKRIPADVDIHQFNKLLDMIDRPVNTNDYNIPQGKPRPVEPTQSVVELPRPSQAPPLPPPLNDIKEEPEAEKQRSEQNGMIPVDDNHSFLTNKNIQCMHGYSGIETLENYDFCPTASGSGKETITKTQAIEKSTSNHHNITVEVEVHVSMESGKSVKKETTITPTNNIQQSKTTAPESTVTESTVTESTTSESAVPESTTSMSVVPESTTSESTVPESTSESTVPESVASESAVHELMASEQSTVLKCTESESKA